MKHVRQLVLCYSNFVMLPYLFPFCSFKDLFNRGAGLYSSLSNSLWEARVIAVISCIKNKEVSSFNYGTVDIFFCIRF